MIKANKRSFAIGFYLRTGWLPWARKLNLREETPHLWLRPSVVRSWGREPAAWILCCGHTMAPNEMDRWLADGLVRLGASSEAGSAIVVEGPNLEVWLDIAWHRLRAASWGNSQ